MKKAIKFFMSLVVSLLFLISCGNRGNSGSSGNNDGNSTVNAKINWPTKIVTVTLPYNAGGDTDIYCRLMSRKLEEKFGQPFVVVNMTGGSGIIAAKTVMAERPDGYNILFNHTGASLVQEATGTADFSYTDDFTNVATVAQDNTYVLIAKSTRWSNLDEMIEEAKANPGQVRYSQVYGSVTHYICSRMEDTMGIELNKLDVGTGAAERLVAFMGDQVDLIAVNYINIEDYVERGDFVVLGVFSEERSPGMEEILTMKEQGYDVVSSKNYEVKFPKGTDQGIVDILSAAIKEITEDEEFTEQLRRYYAIPFYRDQETMNREDREEVARLKEYFE